MKKGKEGKPFKLGWDLPPKDDPLKTLAGNLFRPIQPSLKKLRLPCQRPAPPMACMGAQRNQMADFVQGCQQAVEDAVGNLRKGMKLPPVAWPHWAPQGLLQRAKAAGMSEGKVDGGAQGAVAEPVVEGPPPYDPEKTVRQLKAWREKSEWIEDAPQVKIAIPKGAFCELSSEFKIGLPPDTVFNLLIDPGNQRVFKNIKEVTFRNVLEDDGNRQHVELEQAAIWRFLCWSGTFAVRLFVTQDRREHTLAFRLAQGGFMKNFEGSWKIVPLAVDVPPGNAALLDSDEEIVGRVGSLTTLRQSIQPSMVPPPPVDWYLRGIVSRSMKDLINDLQVEAKRIREGGATVGEVQPVEATVPVRHQELWAVSNTHRSNAALSAGENRSKVLLRREGRVPRSARPKRKTDGTWRDKQHTPGTPRRLPSTPRC